MAAAHTFFTDKADASPSSQAHRTSGGHWVSVAKSRQQNRGIIGLAVEQTAVTLQLHQPKAAGGAPVGEPQRYVSFAMEGKPPPELYTAVEKWLGLPAEKDGWMERVEERLGGGAIVGGYPELLRTVYASVLAASDEEVEAPAAPEGVLALHY